MEYTEIKTDYIMPRVLPTMGITQNKLHRYLKVLYLLPVLYILMQKAGIK